MKGGKGQKTRQRTSRQILLVGKHEEQAILHLPVAKNPVKLLLRLVDPLPILAVHDKDETLCSSIVVSPERSNLVLPTDIPHVEFDILVRHGFDVEANCLGVRE